MKKNLLIMIIGLLSAQITCALNTSSYLETCKKCYTHTHILTCKCQNDHKKWHWSSLARPERCQKVVNENGRLTCEKGPISTHQLAPKQ
jgi:hypothetical protein